MSILEVTEGQQYQSANEEIIYKLTTTNYASGPATVSVKAYDENTGRDMTATVFPTNTPSVTGDVITLSPLKALIKGHTYRIEIKFTAAFNVWEPYFLVKCEV